MIPKQELAGWAREYGVRLTPEMLERLDRYAVFLADWNGRVNLTAITEPREIAVKHFLDSLLLLDACPPGEGAKLADVGAGAGFPSVPVKIARPDLRLTLLDSLGKRTAFLEALSRELGQDNRVVHIRAEEAGRDPAFREGFDLVTARAVAPLPLLCEYCLPLVRPGGTFAALKGPSAAEELREARRAVSLLGGTESGVREYTLPDGGQRSIILLTKRSQTPAKYPRNHGQMKKSPL